VRVPDARQLLERLVAAPSPNPPGDERAAADVVREAAAELGLPEPETYARDARRPNLILRVGERSPTLVLAAHLDTMPPGDVAAWDTDPYRLEEVDGRLVGLGSADMKASVAAMLVAAARHRGRDGTLVLVLAADEENCSAYGMEWLAGERLLRGDAAVLTEPSSLGERSWERLFVAQRGSCVAWLTAHGEPGHSGALVPRERRASAAFARALSALVEADLFAGRSHPVDGTPVTVNVATIVEGGMVAFAHPEALRAAIEVRTLEGMTEEETLAELRRAVAGIDGVTIEPAAPPANWFGPGRTVDDERLLAAVRGAWEEVLGPVPEATVFPAATDATHLAAAGMPALPAFGPGSLAVAHQPNESLPAADLDRAVELFDALVRRYLAI
jgi:acetylornithine deacetylase/succinyl-diaminopimelate desuccinylase-like protein